MQTIVRSLKNGIIFHKRTNLTKKNPSRFFGRDSLFKGISFITEVRGYEFVTYSGSFRSVQAHSTIRRWFVLGRRRSRLPRTT